MTLPQLMLTHHSIGQVFHFSLYVHHIDAEQAHAPLTKENCNTSILPDD